MKDLVRRIDEWLSAQSEVVRALVAVGMFLGMSLALTLLSRLVLGDAGSSILLGL